MKIIELSQGKTALVDNKDFKRVNQFKWYAQKCKQRWYARRNLPDDGGGRGYQFLHQFLFPDAEEIDHRNSNGLDNRRKNLRPCSRTQNQGNVGNRKDNSSGFKGVHLDKREDRWVARVQFGKQRQYLGRFETKEEAALAYNEAAKKRFGNFARLNQI